MATGKFVGLGGERGAEQRCDGEGHAAGLGTKHSSQGTCREGGRREKCMAGAKGWGSRRRSGRFMPSAWCIPEAIPGADAAGGRQRGSAPLCSTGRGEPTSRGWNGGCGVRAAVLVPNVPGCRGGGLSPAGQVLWVGKQNPHQPKWIREPLGSTVVIQSLRRGWGQLGGGEEQGGRGSAPSV